MRTSTLLFGLLVFAACTPVTPITNFDECAAAGNAIMESHPRQCRANGETFVEEIPEENPPSPEALSGAVVSSPLPSSKVESPLLVKGTAPGTWFFEGTLPVMLLDDKGNVIATGHASVEGGWMTADPVKFSATLTFQTKAKTGFLVVSKDNPSGLPENDKSVKIPVTF